MPFIYNNHCKFEILQIKLKNNECKKKKNKIKKTKNISKASPMIAWAPYVGLSKYK